MLTSVNIKKQSAVLESCYLAGIRSSNHVVNIFKAALDEQLLSNCCCVEDFASAVCCVRMVIILRYVYFCALTLQALLYCVLQVYVFTKHCFRSWLWPWVGPV